MLLWVRRPKFLGLPEVALPVGDELTDMVCVGTTFDLDDRTWVVERFVSEDTVEVAELEAAKTAPSLPAAFRPTGQVLEVPLPRSLSEQVTEDLE